MSTQSSVQTYNFQTLQGDLYGGLVAGVIALPLALAFGVQSGLGAAAGLYGAISIGIFAAIFGGTPTQASGPTGPMTVVSAAVVALAIRKYGNIDEGLGFILLCFLLGGVIQIGCGILNVGKYIKYFPYPVISGFMSGVGLIIIILQIWPFLGSGSPKSTIDVITRINEPLSKINFDAVILGALTVATYYIAPLIAKAVPAVLVALLVGTLVSVIFGLSAPTIGVIPTGLPSFQLSTIFTASPSDYSIAFEFGLTLALLGSIDSLLTSVIADNMTKTKHNPKRELIGQGIGNSIAALMGGIPGAGATKGTVVNIAAGGKTRLSPVIHGLFLLVVLLGAGQYASYIPLSVLAGILIPVGLAIIDYKGIRHIRHIPRADLVVGLLVLGFTVFGNLIHAVAIGVVLACVLYMKKTADLMESRTTLTTMAEHAELDEDELESEFYEQYKDQIFIKRLYGPLFFGTAAHFQDLITALLPKAKAVIIRMDKVPYVDQSGLHAFEEAIISLKRKKVTAILTGTHADVLDVLRKVKIVPNLVPEERCFEDFHQGMDWLADHWEDENSH